MKKFIIGLALTMPFLAGAADITDILITSSGIVNRIIILLSSAALAVFVWSRIEG